MSRYLLLSKLNAISNCNRFFFHANARIWVIPVCNMALEVQDEESFEKSYGVGGVLAQKINKYLTEAGADEHSIQYLNYYRTPSAKTISNIVSCDYIVIPGGEMRLGIERLTKLQIVEALRKFSGTIVGNSAGALILFNEYIVTPNWFYSTLRIDKGIGLIHPKWMIEVHYSEENEKQNEGLQCVKRERKTDIYAIKNTGYILCDESECVKMKDVVII